MLLHFYQKGDKEFIYTVYPDKGTEDNKLNANRCLINE